MFSKCKIMSRVSKHAYGHLQRPTKNGQGSEGLLGIVHGSCQRKFCKRVPWHHRASCRLKVTWVPFAVWKKDETAPRVWEIHTKRKGEGTRVTPVDIYWAFTIWQALGWMFYTCLSKVIELRIGRVKPQTRVWKTPNTLSSKLLHLLGVSLELRGGGCRHLGERLSCCRRNTMWEGCISCLLPQ